MYHSTRLPRIWRAGTSRKVASMYSLQIDKAGTLSGHQNPIFAVENGPVPETVFTGGNDKGVVQWNLEAMAFEKILYPVQFSVYALHLIANTPLLAVGTRDGKV